MTDSVSPTVATSEGAKEVSKYARMTPKMWKQAEALWETGEFTLKQLADRFGKTESAFTKHFAKKGVKRAFRAEEVKSRVTEEVVKSSAAEVSVIVERIRETKEEHYKMSAALAKLTWAEILQAKKKEAPVATALGNLKALDTAMNVLKKAREERYAVLGLNAEQDDGDDDLLPKLIISELTPEQIAELQERDDGDSEFQDIHVDDFDDDDDDVTEE